MRSVIVIMDSDRNYADRLCKYMNSRNYMEMKTISCSSADEYIQRYKEYDVRALLVDELHFRGLPHEYRPDFIFVLLEDRLYSSEMETGIRTALKYTSAQTLIKMLLESLDLSMSMHSSGKDAEIIGVFSPVSRSGKTVFSCALGLESSKSEKTLLITLDEYRGILSGPDSMDLSDVMYYYKQGKCTWEQLGKVIRSAKELDYIAPVKYPEDLKELSAGEIRDMLQKISGFGQYSRIIVDFGNFGKHCTEVLSICTKVYMPVMYDCISKLKLEEFDAYLDYVGKDALKERIIKINVPFYKLKQQHNLYSLESTDVAMLARNCIGVAYAGE